MSEKRKFSEGLSSKDTNSIPQIQEKVVVKDEKSLEERIREDVSEALSNYPKGPGSATQAIHVVLNFINKNSRNDIINDSGEENFQERLNRLKLLCSKKGKIPGLNKRPSEEILPVLRKTLEEIENSGIMVEENGPEID